MHIISLFFNYCQLTHIENMSDYCICRTNNASVRPCQKISRTPLALNIQIGGQSGEISKSALVYHGQF